MTLEFQIAEIPERLARGLLTKLPALRFGASVVGGWWQRSETEHALHRLSDRDLADIGIAPSNRSDRRADAAFPEDGRQPEFQPRHFRAGAK
ncbi:DUF1127 domain-containing protein [Rhizobium laguerreae]|uniref:DUF1127 domain-containing protein n=1 Tax=Rhizobium laguerreae TaxID=1076926 RepID=UPI001C91AB78|nr:DUF1127 domain-containing protein [Rhizobium laguerreae]MBY3099632.1 DUF1127 domain-containing protein [Rhizobium laguerreae]